MFATHIIFAACDGLVVLCICCIYHVWTERLDKLLNSVLLLQTIPIVLFFHAVVVPASQSVVHATSPPEKEEEVVYALCACMGL